MYVVRTVIVLQGVYLNDERDGPGLLTYSDGRFDVGMWKRHKLVRISSAVDSPFSLSELGYNLPPGAEMDRLAACKPPERVARSRQEILERLGVVAAPAPFEYPWTPDIEELAAAVLSDTLPPTCLAADLKALDDACIADDCVAVRRRSLGSHCVFERSSHRPSSMMNEDDSFFHAVKAEGEPGSVAASGGGKQHHRVRRDSLTSKTDAQPAVGGSTGLSGVPQPLVHQPSDGSAVSRSIQPDGSGHKHLALRRLSATRSDLHPVFEESTTAPVVADASHPLQLSTTPEEETVAVTEGESGRPPGVAQSPKAVLAWIEVALRGGHGSGTVDLGLDASRPGPLQLLSERFITAAGRGDVDTVTGLLDDGLVSADVADSTGHSAVLAASVRIPHT